MDKPCTCHPDDKRPVPCPKQYAFTECVRRDIAARHQMDVLGVRPSDAHFDELLEIAHRGWPAFRIAQYLDMPEAKWRAMVGR